MAAEPQAAPPAAPPPSGPSAAEVAALRARWAAAWPRALALWSRFVQLSEPRWCETDAAQEEARLADGFA